MAGTSRSRTVLLVAAMLFVQLVVSRPYERHHHRNRTSRVGAEECTSENCKLPDCFCSGLVPPAGLAVSQVPQIVMLTFDDAIAAEVWPYYVDILPEVTNKNGCPMSATFFVSHEWTNYYHVQLLRSMRHEIADHSITHRFPIDWWAKASKVEWSGEIDGQREILRKFGGIDDVRGFRAPFLQVGGNNQFDVLYDGKYLYDSSMNTLQFIDPPIWPYTLDYHTIQECNIPPCPNKTYPGLWEVPLVDLRDKNGVLYAMIDDYRPTSEDDAFEYLELNFNRHFTNNRAPFGIFMHATWFINYPYTVPAMKRFLAKLAETPDVWLVSVSQAIDWIRDPKPASEMMNFPAWQCSTPAPKVCTEAEANQCYYPDSRGGKLCGMKRGLHNSTEVVCPEAKNTAHLMVTCAECPNRYPWYGNPDGN